jgi:hypothetical protein
MRRMSSGENRLSSTALKLQKRRQPYQNGLVEDHSGGYRIEPLRPEEQFQNAISNDARPARGLSELPLSA